MAETTRRELNRNWEFRQIDPAPIPHSDPAAWLPAQVPGHVHLDLMRNGVIPDPYLRMNERTVQWVDDADWEYRTTFEVAASEMSGTRHLLRFNGLDTVAEILVNDKSRIKLAHELGLVLHPYTVDWKNVPAVHKDAKAYMEYLLYDLEIDGLFTNNPDMFPR